MIDTKKEDIQKINDNRIISLDILRIISMLMIITLHFFSYTNISNNIKLFSTEYFIRNFIMSISSIAVNTYILTSGYFGEQSKFKLSKLINLFLEVCFYSIFIYIILLVTNQIQLNYRELFFNFFPTLTRQYWFVTCYIGLYMIAPILRKMVYNLKREEYIFMLLIGFMLFVVYYNFFFFCDNLNFGGATGIVWFAYMYLWGMYFYKYRKPDFKKKHIYNYVIVASIALFSRVPFWIIYMCTGMEIFLKGANIFDSVYNSIFVTLSSLFCFNMFINLDIRCNKYIQKVISFFASSSLAVYLIHDNKYIREILWKSLKFNDILSAFYMIIIWILTIISIYMICSIIDYIRRKIFRYLVENKGIKNAICKFENFMNKNFKKICNSWF